MGAAPGGGPGGPPGPPGGPPMGMRILFVPACILGPLVTEEEVVIVLLPEELVGVAVESGGVPRAE